MAIQRIMVVDDSPTERAFLEEVLKKGGYEVLMASSGAAAVESCLRELPNLVLMDVVMPGVNGFQATRAITRDAKTQHIPVVMCTNKDSETDRVWGLRQGARGYLTKPIQAAALLEKLGELVGGSSGFGKAPTPARPI
jgi:twitching motility two-component system response regulator PilH